MTAFKINPEPVVEMGFDFGPGGTTTWRFARGADGVVRVRLVARGLEVDLDLPADQWQKLTTTLEPGPSRAELAQALWDIHEALLGRDDADDVLVEYGDAFAELAHDTKELAVETRAQLLQAAQRYGIEIGP